MNVPFHSFEDRLDEIYSDINRTKHTLVSMVFALGAHAGQVHKCVRIADWENIHHHMAMVFGFSAAMVRKMRVGYLCDHLLSWFPGVCPHCGLPVCRCYEPDVVSRREKRQPATHCIPGLCIDEVQQMLAGIYSKNSFTDPKRNPAGHLMEELIEVSQLVYAHSHTPMNSPVLKQRLIMEVCDLTAHLFGVANCASINLAETVGRTFENGCPSCEETVCSCSLKLVKRRFPHSVPMEEFAEV